MDLQNSMIQYLQNRKEDNLFRKLKIINDLVDFSSNDYLGLSKSAYLHQLLENDYKNHIFEDSGATGSRLLTGNHVAIEELEAILADFHHAAAALVFNSGFDANVGLLSTVIRKEDIVFYDEYIHASLHQGIKLSYCKSVKYNHNDCIDLQNKLQLERNANGNIFIVTESVFSMEGDKADLITINEISKRYNAYLIVDEAHATGILGTNGSGYCNELQIEQDCFARVYTFGKAIGSHGAVVVGSTLLKEYLVNFSKNFIYTTALDLHTILRVKHTYLSTQIIINQQNKLNKLINYFKCCKNQLLDSYEVLGDGPIFGILVNGNQNCLDLATFLQNNNLDVRAILSPTVTKGKERLRIILHSFNTNQQIDVLFSLLNAYKQQ